MNYATFPLKHFACCEKKFVTIQRKENSVSSELVSFEKRLNHALDSHELCYIPTEAFRLLPANLVTIQRKEISVSNKLVSWHSLLLSIAFLDKKLNYALDSYELSQIPTEGFHLLPASICHYLAKTDFCF